MNTLPRRIGGSHAIHRATVISVSSNRSKCLVAYTAGERRSTVLIESRTGFISYRFPPLGGQLRQIRMDGSGNWVLIDARPEKGEGA